MQLEDAQKYATELLFLDSKFEGKPWRGGEATHEGNFVLGRIAAAEGNLEEAKQYLLKASMSTGSPVLGSFGPKMSLAKDLLQMGERDTVLAYFEQCKTFWRNANCPSGPKIFGKDECPISGAICITESDS